MGKSTLTGTELIDCAKANAILGIAVAACNCGYEEDIDRFLEALKNAGKEMGVKIEQFEDLITEKQRNLKVRSTRILPH
ncbi:MULTISPECIES: hypothetical protein [Spirulina sp. CCY15215]|uniref:hypothetical protein n=1 Tax=Spirulina sp. CCY15215 TaxID=2767591 RepID=UPI0019528396|nr:hypothetical protein [Spirulina major]